MSYSRWNHSFWYTFDHVDGVFAAYRYGSERDNTYTRDEVVKMLDGDWSPMRDPVTDADKVELEGYMLRWLWGVCPRWALGNRRDLVERAVQAKLLIPDVLQPDWVLHAEQKLQ
jgi:hypothetical protein